MKPQGGILLLRKPESEILRRSGSWIASVYHTIDDWNVARKPVEVGRLKSNPLKPRVFDTSELVGLGISEPSTVILKISWHTFGCPRQPPAWPNSPRIAPSRMDCCFLTREGESMDDFLERNMRCCFFWVTSDFFHTMHPNFFLIEKENHEIFVVCFLGQKSNQHSTTANHTHQTTSPSEQRWCIFFQMISWPFGSEDFLRSPVERFPQPSRSMRTSSGAWNRLRGRWKSRSVDVPVAIPSINGVKPFWNLCLLFFFLMGAMVKYIYIYINVLMY